MKHLTIPLTRTKRTKKQIEKVKDANGTHTQTPQNQGSIETIRQKP